MKLISSQERDHASTQFLLILPFSTEIPLELEWLLQVPAAILQKLLLGVQLFTSALLFPSLLITKLSREKLSNLSTLQDLR